MNPQPKYITILLDLTSSQLTLLVIPPKDIWILKDDIWLGIIYPKGMHFLNNICQMTEIFSLPLSLLFISKSKYIWKILRREI